MTTMQVVIFGLGYVGCTAAGCIAKSGHRVIGVDVSEGKVATINAGRSPIEEPGLGQLIADARAAGMIEARTEIGDALAEADIAIVCVGTPSGVDGGHDMRYIIGVTQDIARALAPDRTRPLTIAYRSTMRPGTMEQLIAPILEASLGADAAGRIELVYNPEFLRESSAIDDYFAPPKIVIGTKDGGPSPTIDALHDGIEAPVFHVLFRAAELTKFVDNSWHALKVAFANEVGRVCLTQGIDPQTVHAIFRSDTKLNLSAYYTRPGGAFGGSCLPKDVRALQYIAGELGANTPVVDALMRSNQAHKNFVANMALARLPAKGRVLIAGLAFKAETDDLRESPNIDLARRLLEAGHAVRVFDPAINADKLVGQNLGYAYSQIPQLRSLLVTKAQAEGEAFDLVIRTNRTADALALADTPLLDLDKLQP